MADNKMHSLLGRFFEKKQNTSDPDAVQPPQTGDEVTPGTAESPETGRPAAGAETAAGGPSVEALASDAADAGQISIDDDLFNELLGDVLAEAGADTVAPAAADASPAGTAPSVSAGQDAEAPSFDAAGTADVILGAADAAQEETDAGAGEVPAYDIQEAEAASEAAGPSFEAAADAAAETGEPSFEAPAEPAAVAGAEEFPEVPAGAAGAADADAGIAACEGPAEAENVSDLDPEDAVLMSALGYTDADGIASGNSGRGDFLRSGKSYTDLDHAFAYRGEEYSSRTQNSEIGFAYEKEQKIMLVRAVGTAVFAVLLLIFDLFGKKFGGPLSAANFPSVNILVSLQLLLLCAAFSYRSVASGLVGIVRVRPTSESVTATIFVATALYDVLLAIAAPKAFTLYNFPAALCFAMTVAADWLTLRRQIRTFRKLSSFDSVCTLEKLEPSGREGKKTSSYRLRRGSFAANYFRHVNKRSFPPVYIYVILFVAALALVLFFISLAASRTFVNSLNVFVVVIQFALPSFAILSYVIPFFVMTERKLDENAVIFHESDTQEYDRVKTIVLEEKEIFGESSIKINGIMNCRPGADYFDAIEATSAILNRVGGTISYAFRSVYDGATSGVAAEKVKVFDNGVEGDVNGVHYVIGTAEFLGKRWINCPDSDNRRYLSSVRGGLVLYIAADGAAVLRITMQYALESMFVGLVGDLAERNIRVVLRCRDPFLTSDLAAELIARNDLPVYVVRTEEADDESDTVSGAASDEAAGTGVIDGGLIADGVEWMSAVRAADMCVLFRKWNRLHFYICAATVGLGIVIAAFLGALGAVVGMSPLYIVLFQLLSVVPSVVMSKLLFD